MSIRAGASVRDITPEGQVRLARRTGPGRLSTGILDPLLVSAIHLRGGAGGVMILSLDLLCLSPSVIRRIRKRIVETTGTHAHNIMIGTTQNHSGPVVGFDPYVSGDPQNIKQHDAYIENIVNQAVQAASEAAVASVPAEVAVVSLAEPHTGAMLVKNGRNNRIMAAIVLCGEVPDCLGADNSSLSSDFVHSVRERLAARFGHSPVTALFVGPSGRVQVAGKTRMAKEVGEGLADQVLAEVKKLSSSDLLSNLSFEGRLAEVPDILRCHLPSKFDVAMELNEAIEAWSKVEKEGGSVEERDIAERDVSAARRKSAFVALRDDELLTGVVNDYIPAEIQVMAIGAIRLLCMPGFLEAGCGTDLARRFGEHVWIIECGSGDMLRSVLTGCGADGAGEYPLRSAIFDPGTGKAMVDVAMSLLAL